ncbi:hypothetical protein EVAR_16463_1 [Eumeta japonica]|uniref:DUF5641 domain-containing protein n=1 Tax=Eumeta variegata TaxID=151549 RepID=A0A4C1UKA6_EUMVA|nr:hypothetical protein EVAR_16463_1 [Eumeta japonica]
MPYHKGRSPGNSSITRAIMALKRTIARCGCSTEIWSDNGTDLCSTTQVLPHFLSGGSAAAHTSDAFDKSDLDSRAQWQAYEQLMDMFWSRWLREYLPELQHRRQLHARDGTIQVDDIVLIADNTLLQHLASRCHQGSITPGADSHTGRRRTDEKWAYYENDDRYKRRR